VQSASAAQKFVSSRVLATRQGTIFVGLGAALLAGLVLLIYLSQYRESVSSKGEPVQVLVAKSLIEKGTTGEQIGAKGLFETVDFPRDEVKTGAFTDPSSLSGTAAVKDIFPNQQLTAEDLTVAGAGGWGATLVDRQRAIAIPIDKAHGLTGTLLAGDKVDIYAGFNVQKNSGGSGSVMQLLMQNILVLQPAAGDTGGGIGNSNSGSDTLLRVTPPQAQKLAFVVENGVLWFVLRPRSGAPPTKPSIVTMQSLLLGTKAVG
jgi:Flp pilus assembly protein CpaB